MKKIYRTIIQYEVLSSDPIPGDMSLREIDYECEQGMYSGRSLPNVETNKVLEGDEAIKAIEAQGSDPDFFFMERDAEPDEYDNE
jgi:hypothetical protein